MIRIEFTGDDLLKLKNEVREFAIIHLGINFANEAAKINSPPPSPNTLPTIQTPMPVPEKAPMHTMTENSALPPRGKPGRKPKAQAEPNPANETVQIPQEDFLTEAAGKSADAPIPSQEDVNNSIRSLVAKDGNNLDRAREFLARFKVSKGKDLKENQRAEFIKLVTETLAK